MSKTTKDYKILYADKLEAVSRPGLIFNSQMIAEDYIKKASKENPRFHYWVEVMPDSQEAFDAAMGVQEVVDGITGA